MASLAVVGASLLLAACGPAKPAAKPPAATASVATATASTFVPAKAPACPAAARLGTGWQSESLPTGDTHVLALAATDPCHVWTGGTTASGAAFLLFSTSAGMAWTVGNLPPGYAAIRGIAMATATKGWAVADTGGTGAVLATVDGGRDWTLAKAFPAAADLAGIATDGGTRIWAVGQSPAHHALIFASQDGGRTWSAQTPPGGTLALQSVVSAGGTSAWAGGSQGALLLTSDSGSHWVLAPGTTLGTTVTGLAVAAGQAWAVGYLAADAAHRGVGLHRSSSLWLPLPFPAGTGELDAIAASGTKYAWAVGHGPGGAASILATSDGGSTWSQQAPAGAFALDAVAFANSGAGWVGGTGGILATIDSGTAH